MQKKNPNENVIKVQKKNQEKLVIVVRFQKFQKERKDDQEKMFSLIKLMEDKFKQWEENSTTKKS